MLQAALDQILATGATAALARVDSPSGSWRGSSGVVELGRPARPSAVGRYRVGSITKTFVATVILQLVGERRLGLDDTLERWLPGAVPNGARITIRNLLQHTSGIFNYTDILFASIEDVLQNRYRTFRPEELVALAAGQPPVFESGTSWSYSNTNYILLGQIVRKVTGWAYGKEVDRRIRQPLRLYGTEVPGLGIYQEPLPGGPTLWGHTGGIMGFGSYSFHAGRRNPAEHLDQPWLGDFGPAMLDLALTAFGVTAPSTLRAAAPFPVLGFRPPPA